MASIKKSSSKSRRTPSLFQLSFSKWVIACIAIVLISLLIRHLYMMRQETIQREAIGSFRSSLGITPGAGPLRVTPDWEITYFEDSTKFQERNGKFEIIVPNELQAVKNGIYSHISINSQTREQSNNLHMEITAMPKGGDSENVQSAIIFWNKASEDGSILKNSVKETRLNGFQAAYAQTKTGEELYIIFNNKYKYAISRDITRDNSVDSHKLDTVLSSFRIID